MPSPPGRPSSNRNHSGPGTRPLRTDEKSSESKKGLTAGALVGIIVGSVFVALILLLAIFFCIRKYKREGSVARPSRGNLSVGTNNG